MFIRFLKKMVVALSLLLATQGCAIFVGDDGGFHHFHHFHHGYGGHGHSSLQQNRVAENGAGESDEGGR